MRKRDNHLDKLLLKGNSHPRVWAMLGGFLPKRTDVGLGDSTVRWGKLMDMTSVRWSGSSPAGENQADSMGPLYDVMRWHFASVVFLCKTCNQSDYERNSRQT